MPTNKNICPVCHAYCQKSNSSTNPFALNMFNKCPSCGFSYDPENYEEAHERAQEIKKKEKENVDNDGRTPTR